MDGMQVKDLIKRLQELNPDLEVYMVIETRDKDIGARINDVREYPGMIELQGFE